MNVSIFCVICCWAHVESTVRVNWVPLFNFIVCIVCRATFSRVSITESVVSPFHCVFIHRFVRSIYNNSIVISVNSDRSSCCYWIIFIKTTVSSFTATIKAAAPVLSAILYCPCHQLPPSLLWQIHYLRRLQILQLLCGVGDARSAHNVRVVRGHCDLHHLRSLRESSRSRFACLRYVLGIYFILESSSSFHPCRMKVWHCILVTECMRCL